MSNDISEKGLEMLVMNPMTGEAGRTVAGRVDETPDFIAQEMTGGRAWFAGSPKDYDRVDAQRALIGLDGKSILFPEQKQFAPKQQALEWREKRLRAGWMK